MNCPDCNHPLDEHLPGSGCLVQTGLEFCVCSLSPGQIQARLLPAGTYPAATGDAAAAVGDTGHVAGKRGARQAETLAALKGAGSQGMTWTDLSARFGWHHGVASGVLSMLHKAGKVARLAEKRGNRSVYVLPVFVMSRKTIDPKSQRKTLLQPAGRAAVEQLQVDLADAEGASVVVATADLRVALDLIAGLES